MPLTPSSPLTVLAPYPAAYSLPAHYDRHHPDVHETARAMWSMVNRHPWAELSWVELVDSLMALGRTDVPLSRLVEGHVDAVRILAEARRPPVPDTLYAVWASRSHATGIAARQCAAGWVITGTLRFASGAGVVHRALVPIWLEDGTHLLVDVDVTRWPVDESAWKTPAMAVSRSHSITLSGVQVSTDARVGEPGFYLGRRGFHAGGTGVAAVWAGGAARVADTTLAHVADAPPSPFGSAHLGHIRTELAAANALVRTAASVLEGKPRAEDLRTLATETRAGVAASARRLIEHTRHLVGPAGLSHSQDLTHAVDDLDLFVRQQHRDHDAQFLGEQP